MVSLALFEALDHPAGELLFGAKIVEDELATSKAKPLRR
jgi:hypothetical protein